jgi:hypothetical protein
MAQIDLRDALQEWPHDPEQVSVRKIIGADGTPRIQMRVELGILQMEITGRPDGLQPFSCDSLLTYHQRRMRAHEAHNGTALGFSLTPRECAALRAEGSQFYRRFVAFFVLEEYENVIHDTTHNLGIFDLCRNFGFNRQDRTCMEPYRPYVLMMEARARAHVALAEGEHASALAHVNRGILQIRALFDESEAADLNETCQEIKTLAKMAQEIGQQMPRDSLLLQRKALRAAIAEERFEEAARIRDAIRNPERRKR